MKRTITLAMVIAIAIVSYIPYQLYYETQQLEKDLSELRRDISKNKQAIRILKAEWAYENRPEKLQALAAKYLPLLLVSPHQVATLGEVPRRAIDPYMVSTKAIPVPRKRPGLKKWQSKPPVRGPMHLAAFKKNNQAARIVK
ncbi:hypothetical protein [Sneathiella sp.]|jgi:hypothetical protein|uniref:cell division protein FtsL n=1 Tax=Sneathiella sp. TaxID=1964365 RepID=UPI0039E545A9